MSVDIVEIALEYCTDWATFEKLAAEIMRDEGYAGIHPLGGSKDGGKDAEHEALYKSSGPRLTVFQFTLRADVEAKTAQTIARLAESGEAFDQLVLVTRAEVSTQRKHQLRKATRSTHSVGLTIFDRKVIVNRLADISNGIFQRHFPDIRSQAELLLAHRDNVAAADVHHSLRVCHAFFLHDRASAVRRSLIDNVVLRTLVSVQSATVPELREAIAKEVLSAAPTTAQLREALNRLQQEGLAEIVDGSWRVTFEARAMLEGRRIALGWKEAAVLSDIGAKVVAACDRQVSAQEKALLERNARQILAAFFKLRGLELANTYLRDAAPSPVYEAALPTLQKEARRGVAADLGDILLTALAEALHNPSPEQAKHFACCARAYLAVQVMNQDPTVMELETDRLRTKKFVLDTDFVLHCLIRDLPARRTYIQLVRALLEAECQVVVPLTVLAEVQIHFKIAVRHFDRASQVLSDMSEPVMLVDVHNALVRGYWYSLAGAHPAKSRFMKYRRDYYDPTEPEAYLKQLISNIMPGVTIGDIGTVLGATLESPRLATIERAIGDLAKKSISGQSRTREENLALASNDSRLMLAVMEYNDSRARESRPLGQAAYIVTGSARYLRASAKLHLPNRVTARPEVLIELLELVGKTAVADTELISLFENSLLQSALRDIMDDVRALLDYGVSLRDVSVTRLKWDADKGFHKRIVALRKKDEGKTANAKRAARRDKHIALLNTAGNLGYSLAPALERWASRDRSKEDHIANLEAENAAFRSALEKRRKWVAKQRKKKQDKKKAAKKKRVKRRGRG